MGVDYPIIQGPLGGLSTARLTAAVSNFGALGSFGAQGLAPHAIAQAITEIRARTTKPFAMNLWVSTEDAGVATTTEAQFRRALASVTHDIERLGGTVPTFTPYVPIRFEDQARVVLDANVPVFSFIFGVPPREMLDECRTRNMITIGTATTPQEAVALEAAGVDIIVASGSEAGGHRGSFLRPAKDSLVGTIALVPQVVDRVQVPVVAAGGIADARGMLAALALGADGVQIGTAFLACEESGATPLHREALLSHAGTTTLTRGLSGRLARAIRNRLLDDLDQPGVEILPYPLQRLLVGHVSRAAERAGERELIPLWSGQIASALRWRTATDLLQALVSGGRRTGPPG